jgi:hypothetical protein
MRTFVEHGQAVRLLHKMFQQPVGLNLLEHHEDAEEEPRVSARHCADALQRLLARRIAMKAAELKLLHNLNHSMGRLDVAHQQRILDDTAEWMWVEGDTVRYVCAL